MVSSLSLASCVDGVWEERSDVLASRRSSHLTETGRMVGSQGPACCRTCTRRGAHLTSTSREHRTPRLSWSTFHQNHRCMPCELLMWNTFLQRQRKSTPRQLLQCMPQKFLWWSTFAPAPAASYATPAPLRYVAPAPVVEYISPDPAECVAAETAASYAALAPTVFAAPAPVVEYIAPAPAGSCTVPEHTVFPVAAPVGECFSPAPEVSYAAPAPVVEYISSDPAVYHLPLSWSTSHQRQLGTQGLHLMRRSTSSRRRGWRRRITPP